MFGTIKFLGDATDYMKLLPRLELYDKAEAATLSAAIINSEGALLV